MSNRLIEVIDNKRVLVCCGAGGVGKTTVAASLALCAARRGRRVLVVTVDPSRRLAETLGVARHSSHPMMLAAHRLAEAGVEPPGQLEAWMLDPKSVSDQAVARMSNPDDAARLMQNRIYHHVTEMIAGMQEYTAVEALYEFVRDDRYDLVVLDTPPSRNALNFLEAPSRVGRFLDGRVFKLFMPGEGGIIRRAASKLIERAMDMAFGQETREELQVFFELFAIILGGLNRNAHSMRDYFASDAVGFLIVTSPRQEALVEADYFASRTRDDMGLNLEAVVLNQSLAGVIDGTFPRDFARERGLGRAIDGDAAMLRAALEKLEILAASEVELRDRHRTVLDSLSRDAGEGAFAMALPFLPDGVHDMADLARLADALVTD